MVTEHKLWFNTGVTWQHREGVPLMEHQAWRGGTLQIAFYLEYAPPTGSIFIYLQRHLEKREGRAFIPVVGGGMAPSFAVFLVNEGVEKS